MGSYSILQDIYNRKSMSSLDRDYTYKSERFDSIIRNIDNNDTFYYIDEFNNGTRANIVIMNRTIDEKLPTVIFIAHWDVVNPDFDNVQDNTASVSNILQLAKETKNFKGNINLVFVLTDGEELVSYNNSGAAQLSRSINKGDFGKVLEVINLELTAKGDTVWGFGDSAIIKYDRLFAINSTPYSDSSVLQHHKIKSTCIGLLSYEEALISRSTGYCDTWGLCHNKDDTMDKSSEKDMSNLIQFLIEYLNTF